MSISVHVILVVFTLKICFGYSITVMFGNVLMPSNLSDALNTSRHRKIINEAA